MNTIVYKVIITNDDCSANRDFSTETYWFLNKAKAIAYANKKICEIKETHDLPFDINEKYFGNVSLKIRNYYTSYTIQDTFNGNYIIQIIKDTIEENEDGIINETLISTEGVM